MPDFADLLQRGGAHAWLYFPSAILLGAFHGLEPGHSKTMMAAFIVAIGGSVKQAVMLGLAATLSHTAVVWGAAAAIGARKASNRFPWLNAAARRAPYLSSMLIICVGVYVGVHGWNGLYS